ncbi:hypothetical protein MNBD_GAMMA26-821 [hydrothermal vent metagenome]|uniref:STAS domain-containing protein n=1 Tax=hydrothermal vent metagenome TaxID=652676 RepID=A0A3B1BSQ8_9ZZZZ
MSLTSSISQDGNTLTICLGERFDFSSHEQFRGAYKEADAKNIAISIDFSKTEYIDSAALGMLLVLRERAGGDRANITLGSCRTSIQQIMDISNFAKLFRIAA